jgi:heme/copper-type cytochrome/quinol oxidase subunit 2
MAIFGGIFVTVFILLVYSVVKFRRRADDDDREPPRSTTAIRWNSGRGTWHTPA